METPLPLKILCSGTYSKCKNIIGYLFLEKWETTVAVKSSHGVFSPSTQLLVYSGLEEKRKKLIKSQRNHWILGDIFAEFGIREYMLGIREYSSDVSSAASSLLWYPDNIKMSQI